MDRHVKEKNRPAAAQPEYRGAVRIVWLAAAQASRNKPRRAVSSPRIRSLTASLSHSSAKSISPAIRRRQRLRIKNPAMSDHFAPHSFHVTRQLIAPSTSSGYVPAPRFLLTSRMPLSVIVLRCNPNYWSHSGSNGMTLTFAVSRVRQTEFLAP
jgi:hypothetical protein